MHYNLFSVPLIKRYNNKNDKLRIIWNKNSLFTTFKYMIYQGLQFKDPLPRIRITQWVSLHQNLKVNTDLSDLYIIFIWWTLTLILFETSTFIYFVLTLNIFIFIFNLFNSVAQTLNCTAVYWDTGLITVEILPEHFCAQEEFQNSVLCTVFYFKINCVTDNNTGSLKTIEHRSCIKAWYKIAPGQRKYCGVVLELVT